MEIEDNNWGMFEKEGTMILVTESICWGKLVSCPTRWSMYWYLVSVMITQITERQGLITFSFSQSQLLLSLDLHQSTCNFHPGWVSVQFHPTPRISLSVHESPSRKVSQHICISAGIWIYRGLIGRSCIALAQQAQIYRNTSDPFGRVARLHCNALLINIQWISHCRESNNS